ncbi:MAG: hypothetical protein JWL69_3303, partial [Phycisphaerales bacterium]|nr:hypothetical protein [Phycisphaerales bacterium]
MPRRSEHRAGSGVRFDYTSCPMPDLSVNLAGLRLANPMLTCSGTCGYAFE